MKKGAKAILRPKKYATSNSSSEIAWLHAIKYLEKKIIFDTIVAPQATSPIRGKNDFDKALIKFELNNFDSLFQLRIKRFFVWKKK